MFDCLQGPTPHDVARRAGVLNEFCSKFLAILSCGVLQDAVRLLSGPTSAAPHVSPEVVHGAIIRGLKLSGTLPDFVPSISSRSALCTTIFLVQFVWPGSLMSIRRTFRSSASSQGDPSEQVRFSGQHDEAHWRQEILNSWPTHFSSVASPDSSFDEAFFQSVSARLLRFPLSSHSPPHPWMQPSLQQNYVTH